MCYTTHYNPFYETPCSPQYLGAPPHGERGIARAYYGGLDAEPPAGSRGRAPGQVARGRSPPEAEALFGFWTFKFAHFPNNKFELMLTRRAKAYSSSSSR